MVASRGGRRQMIGTALAGLILGLGSVCVGSSLVKASERDGVAGFFEMLFGGGARRQAELRSPPPPTRYNALPSHRLDRIPRRVAHTPRPESFSFDHEDRPRRRRAKAVEVAALSPGRSGDRTVCVRRCDGYLFPLGSLRDPADLPLHKSGCAAACPHAATDVYTLAAGETELERAVSGSGLPYRASAVANVYRQRRVADCSCQPAGGAVHAALETDPTLRRGDIIATGTSAQVVTGLRSGRVDLQDYRRAAIGRGQVRAIDARVGTIRRESAARSFRQQLRAVERSAVVQLAGAGEVVLPVRAADGAGPRVVAPSPYAR
ncbi:DUF2865 domain-containing protein [Methylobacterium sp. J-076]|uniref:DUF2865 domain-containing protein n=1 Tax=Methylobacterium sp. J-076 TaxID=2836655 RepID=UPI001FBBAD92|nr:DUF2865 domain-containing protein [Methylobacterium sp. J-076]MCJ2014667.1 DUF2865 domain-containing protein [Methylobacterium sp. J-076]